MLKILVIDNRRSFRNTLRESLEFEKYAVETAEGLEDARELYERIPFDIVVCTDTIFGEYASSGLKMMDNAHVVIVPEQPSIEGCVSALREGAYDYVAQPRDKNSILSSVKAAAEQVDKGPDQPLPVRTVTRPKAKRTPGVGEIIGTSPQIMHVKTLIEKVAPSEARVLVTGPNGTGKELVARWLHEKSNRCDAPFVEVNCAAIPSELIESELFGHEKGAFTSAIKQRKGKFELANGGTLFLDEIGDMSLSAQAKVLRALQENRICRVGSDKDVVVDVRIIAATNKNLRDEIMKCNFREDLYHRLSVIVINVPPLVDRLDDLPMLVDYFADQISEDYGISPKGIHKAALEELKTMDWTGNIRELRNVIERLIILSGEEITKEDVKTYAAGTA